MWRYPNMLLATTAALLLALLAAPAVLWAQNKPQRVEIGQKPESVLWVGNSFFYYNDSMHNHFGRLVRSMGPDAGVRGTSVTISGAGLDWHDMDSLLRPNGLGRYSIVGDNEIRFTNRGVNTTPPS